MRYIVIPENITLRSLLIPETGKHPDQDFVGFMQHVLADHKDTVATNQSLTVFLGAARRFDGKKPGDVVSVTDEEHELLCNLARTYPYAPASKLDMFAFVAHLIEASKEDPSKAIEGKPKGDEHRVRTKR